MNIGKLLASRNAKTVRFNAVRAGVLDMPTSEVVNGALAACPHHLGARILECIHSPECGDPEWVEREVLGIMVRERTRRAARVVDAEIAWHLASIDKSARYSEAQAFQRYDEAKAARWPAFDRGKYADIAEGVFHELLRKHLCQCCGGRGSTLDNQLVRVCAACAGTGRATLTPYARASLCGMHHAAFSRAWDEVYAWMFARMHSEVRAAEDFIFAYAHERAA